MIRIIGDIDGYYCTIKLSYPSPCIWSLWHNNYSSHSYSATLRATQVVWTQMMVTLGIWYIDEGFLVWIIPSTYQSHESKVWACITSFVPICIWYITWCLTVYTCVPVIMTLFFIHAFLFRFIDTHVLLYARHLALILPLVGEFSDSPRSACLDPGV